MVKLDYSAIIFLFIIGIMFLLVFAWRRNIARKKEMEAFFDEEKKEHGEFGEQKKDTKEKPVLKINMGGSSKVIGETDDTGNLKHVEISEKWKCVVCETMNDGSICVVCGNEKSA